MVHFAVKSKDEHVTDICYLVEHQQIDSAKQTCSHLQSLELVGQQS